MPDAVEVGAADLGDVLERLRKATGADRSLDLLIGEATNSPMGLSGDAIGLGYPRFTASLDAALALVERVLPGACWRIEKTPPAVRGEEPPFWATAGLPGEQEQAVGNTPAIALLIAALSALSATEGK